MDFTRVQDVITDNVVIDITKADIGLVKEVQSLLGLTVDGIVGQATLKLFADFKAKVYLSGERLLGKTTAEALLEIANGHRATAENVTNFGFPPLTDSQTGVEIVLPNSNTVWSNQLIIPGVPLTWGEFTKDGDRVPESNEIVRNIIKAARGFGNIRNKYGSPLVVNSGYRTPKVNREVGGARFSQHVNGLALDICPADGSLQKLYQLVRTSDCVGIGRGMHRGFVHVDWRDGDPSEKIYFDYP